METLYNILLIVAVIVAVVVAMLIFLTGKGDAMSSGGGGIRTSFKGKASFDDQISRITLILSISFGALMLVLDAIASRIF